MIADVAAYYGQSPVDVEQWATGQIVEWHNAALSLEKKAKDKADKTPTPSNSP